MSTRYVAFVRAINVAGHASVRMTDLREAFAAAGCRNVRTYIQSGNAVFDADPQRTATVFRRARSALAELVGGKAAVMFFTFRQLDDLVNAGVFGRRREGPELKLYLAFFAEPPKRRPELPLKSAKEALEVLAVTDEAAFIVSGRKPSGMFGFPNNFVEKELEVTATSRKMSTLQKLLTIAGGDL